MEGEVKAADGRRFVRRSLFVPEDLWQAVRAAAALNHMSASAWIRGRCQAAVSKEVRRVVTIDPKSRATGDMGDA